jgi:hypothetical protein
MDLLPEMHVFALQVLSGLRAAVACRVAQECVLRSGDDINQAADACVDVGWRWAGGGLRLEQGCAAYQGDYECEQELHEDIDYLGGRCF